MDLPTGTVTFLFTDVEGSTKLLRRLGNRFDIVIEDHGRLLREAITGGGGVEVRTEGDAFFASFPTATGALQAAVDGQRAVAAHAWPDEEKVRVRMGLHTGEGRLSGDDYVGIDVHLAARIAAAGHGGQIVLSAATRTLIEHALPTGTALRDLGLHRLKDIEHPTQLHDLVIAGLPTDFAPIRSLDARRSNLPAQRTSFVGRESELAGVVELVETARLVTLTGPGGTGKTRLALEAAGRLQDGFSDGVFLVDLSPILDPVLVPSAVAGVLHLREEAARDIMDTLADHLRDLDLLMVFDNVEQVIDAALTVSRLLDAAPGLRVLATSRVPLHLSGEREFPVPPLGLPDPRHPPAPDALSQYEAVALFIDRAVEVRPDFRVTDESASAVAEIAVRLDGLPLAIELAASRVKVLTPEGMLARLGERLPLLSGGARDRPERQQTLRGAIDWSHDLLDEPERSLFARLAVFSSGCTLEAAEAVCGEGTRGGVLDVLASLVDKSLVRHGGAADGEARFTMLETIREYALEQLEGSGEQHETRGRHSEFFLALAEEAEPNLIGDDQAVWLARLDREHDNVRAALGRAVDHGDSERGMRLAAALWRFWQQRGYLVEGRMWLERVFALPKGSRRDRVRVRALGALGGIAYWQNDYGPMSAAYEEAVEIGREVGDDGVLGRALLDLSFVPMVKGDMDGAEPIMCESLEAARRGGDRGVAAEATAGLGFLELFRGNPAAAREALEDAASLQLELGNRYLLADYTVGLGGIAIAMADPDTAVERFRESLQMADEVGNVLGVGQGLFGLAMAADGAGEHVRAARLLGASARVRDEAGGGAPPELMTRMGDPEGSTRAALGEERFEAAQAEGYAMDMASAVSYALSNDE